MPYDTPVHRLYEKLKGKRGKASAARIAQAKTGKSLKTGKRPKKKSANACAMKVMPGHSYIQGKVL